MPSTSFRPSKPVSITAYGNTAIRISSIGPSRRETGEGLLIDTAPTNLKTHGDRQFRTRPGARCRFPIIAIAATGKAISIRLLRQRPDRRMVEAGHPVGPGPRLGFRLAPNLAPRGDFARP